MNERKPLTREDFNAFMLGLPQEDKDKLWEWITEQKSEDLSEPEYLMECSMCGKETPHRYCGMCTHCEMVWNG